MTIPDSVTEIGKNAFWRCASLTSVTIPNGVMEIGEDAFMGCASLASVAIPESVTVIGNYAFMGCVCLTSVKIPDSVTEINSYAFRGCKSLTSVMMPESVTNIWSGAFEDCTALERISIPSSISDLRSKNLFDTCTGLKCIDIAKGVYINRRLLQLTQFFKDKLEEGKEIIINDLLIDGSNCKGSVSVPGGIRAITEEAFSKCIKLERVVVKGDSLKVIGNSAFEGCKELKTIELPDSVESYGNKMCMGCEALKEMTFSQNTKKIGDKILDKSGVEKLVVPENRAGYTVQDGVLKKGNFSKVIFALPGADNLTNEVDRIPPKKWLIIKESDVDSKKKLKIINDKGYKVLIVDFAIMNKLSMETTYDSFDFIRICTDKKNYDFDLRMAKKELKCKKLEKYGMREICNPKPELNERDLAIGLMYGVYRGHFNKNEFGLVRYKLKRSKDYAIFVSPIFDLLYEVTEVIKDIHGTDVTDIWTRFVDECLEFAEDEKLTNLKAKVKAFFCRASGDDVCIEKSR